MDSGEPVDTDDRIAQEHDLAYEIAECVEDVHRADKRAISSFLYDWYTNRNWHSMMGAIGISIKHCTERLLRRVFYPRLQDNQNRLTNPKQTK